MSTYNQFFNNNLPEKTCPNCNKTYPLDWFGAERKIFIRRKNSYRVLRVLRFRKFVNCWKCRNVHGLDELTDPAPLINSSAIEDSTVKEVFDCDVV